MTADRRPVGKPNGDAEAELAAADAEMGEALEAAGETLEQIAEVRGDIAGAEGWSAVDLFGGGLASSLIKHSALDDPRARLPRLQRHLDRLAKECLDAGVSFAPAGAVEVLGGSRFVDVFLDNIVTDLLSQQKIEASAESVDRCRQAVKQAAAALQEKRRPLEERLGQLAREKEQILGR